MGFVQRRSSGWQHCWITHVSCRELNITSRCVFNRHMSNAVGQRMIELAPGAVDLWLAACDPCGDPRVEPACQVILNSAELEQARRFHFAADRFQYRFSRALVRTVLSYYAPVAPPDWLFDTNAHGRPEVANPQGPASGLSFNLSHTRYMVALAITTHAALGVDVENVSARSVSLEIARRWFAPEEVTALRAVPEREQQYRFFEYWTLKEAYVKARGMGLSLPLDKFSFHYPDDREVTLSICPELMDDPARWQLWQIQPTSQHLVAVCAERSGTHPSSLTVRWADPEFGATRILPEPPRASCRDMIRRLSNRDRSPRGRVHV
jgi:4'-phosphopantetheinyl transferase